MKKLISTAAVLFLATNANATISRLKALGMSETDNEGSYYIEDDRNIFLNVANVNDYSDTVILEWGGSGNNLGSASLATDADTSPKAKGGFLKKHGNYTYGVYLGNESNTASLLRGVATGAHAAQATLATGSQGLGADSMIDGADNQIDLFFAGKTSSFDWGTNFVYTSDRDDSSLSRDTAHAVRLGLKADRWDAFANISTGSKSRKTTAHNFVGLGATFNGTVYSEFNGKLGLHLGGGYKLNDTCKVYGFVKKFDWEQTDTGGTTAGFGATSLNGRGQFGTVEAGFMTYAVGYGHQAKAGKGTFFGNVEYRSKEIEVKFREKAEGKNVNLPVTVGYEYDATSWLTLRGSIKQNVYGYRNNNKYTSLNIVANFGSIKVDGFVGTAGTNGTATTTDAGTLSLDRLMTRVGMTYNF